MVKILLNSDCLQPSGRFVGGEATGSPSACILLCLVGKTVLAHMCLCV